MPWPIRSGLHRRVGKHIDLDDFPPFDVQPPIGPALRFHHGDTTDYLWWLGEYERATLELFCHLAAGCEVILDVGARDGVFTLFGAAANPEAQVVAFEADPEAVLALQANVALNQSLAAGRVTVIDAALGTLDGTASLYLSGGNSSLDPQFRAGASLIEVTVRRGDSVLDELALGKGVGLMKIDTEATEPDVLTGLDETIRRDRSLIVCEVLAGRTEDRLQDFVERHGYGVWRITGQGLARLPRVIADPSYRDPNVLLAPADWSIPPDIHGRAGGQRASGDTLP